MRVQRLPITSLLLTHAWKLRDNVAMRDALYVAAAVRLGGTVLTTDDRLRHAAPDHTTGVTSRLRRSGCHRSAERAKPT